jgi:DNA-nicking Smr family endonuclease
MRRALTPAEAALWRRVARSAQPLPGKTTTAGEEREPPPRARRAAPSVQPPRAPGVHRAPGAVADRAGEKRVRRGRVEAAASLDLHGFTETAARAALSAFLLRQASEGARAVIVITGKGRGGEEGLLKRRLPHWLNAPDLRADIAGFAQAHRRHGGAGAFYVFLKRARAD